MPACLQLAVFVAASLQFAWPLVSLKNLTLPLTVTGASSDVVAEFVSVRGSVASGTAHSMRPASHPISRGRSARAATRPRGPRLSIARAFFCNGGEAGALRAQFCKARAHARQCRKNQPGVKREQRGFLHDSRYRVDDAARIFLFAHRSSILEKIPPRMCVAMILKEISE
jgi:hypothetical protein